MKIDLSTLEGISVYKELGDFSGTLKELKDNVDSLIELHGEHSYVNFDAGYNNIDCNLVTEEIIANHQKIQKEIEAKKQLEHEAKALKKKVKKEKDKKKNILTIYNTTYPKNSVSKGLVEIINVYDYTYYVLAIDGKVIETTDKQSYEKSVLKRSFIQKCTTLSGVDDESLMFVLVDWCDFLSNRLDYDANDYLGDYSAFIDTINHVGPVSDNFIKFLALGITDLEETM